MAHIEIENLTFSYPSAGRPSLSDISLTIRRGEYVVLCGKSGSGKTTLLRHLKSVLAPHGKRSGDIRINGVSLKDMSQRDQAAKVGFVMQNPDDQIVTDKVWHELAFGLESLGCDQKTMRARVAEMACYFGIQDWFHRDVANLSGGQKQLLNLASIMAMQPEILILDEPTSQLGPIAAYDFLNTLRKINAELGTTILITEHRVEDIFPYADRAIVMDGGKVIANDTPRNIGKRLWEEKNDMFTAMPTPVRVFYGSGGAGECPLTVREGRNWLSDIFPNPPEITELPAQLQTEEDGEIALSLKELWFRYEKNSPDVLRGASVEGKPSRHRGRQRRGKIHNTESRLRHLQTLSGQGEGAGKAGGKIQIAGAVPGLPRHASSGPQEPVRQENGAGRFAGNDAKRAGYPGNGGNLSDHVPAEKPSLRSVRR